MPQIRIHCNGGLGNRLNALASGLLAARIGGWEPVIDWKPNDNCAAGLPDIYDRLPCAYDENLPACDWPLMTHMDWAGRICFPHTDASLQALKGRDIEFTHHNIHWGDTDAVRGAMTGFTVQPAIRDYALQFVNEHRIDHSVLGLHVRATDAKYRNTLHNASLREAQKPGRRCFVCSDEAAVEAEFAALGEHILILPKTHYVEKRVDGDWRIDPPDGLAHHCYNVRRTRESVIEAFADLLVLSRTWIRANSSSFNEWARVYAGMDW